MAPQVNDTISCLHEQLVATEEARGTLALEEQYVCDRVRRHAARPEPARPPEPTIAHAARLSPCAGTQVQRVEAEAARGSLALSQRSNVDFQPLINHFAAHEYATKYIAKEDKGSASLKDKGSASRLPRGAVCSEEASC